MEYPMNDESVSTELTELQSEILPVEQMTEGTLAFTRDQWRDYIAAASVQELDTILEKGKRIREFHAEYWRDRDKWGRDWSGTCKDVLGLSTNTCYKYEIIHRVFTPDLLSRTRHILPMEVTTLSLIATAVLYDRTSVSQVADKGAIAPEMTQDTARKILATAKEVAQRSAADLIKDGRTDTQILALYPGLNTRQINEIRKEVAESAVNLNPEDVGPDVATISTSPPVTQAPPPAREAPQPVPRMEVTPPPPPVSPLSEIGDDIDRLGTIIGDDELDEILKACVEHPQVFQTIFHWYSKFGPTVVTNVLREVKGFK
jgi:hypothetical protein